MARTVNCSYLKRQAEGLDFAPYPGEREGPFPLADGSEAWLRGLLLAPGSVTYFGDKNDMPAFGKKLSDGEIARLSAFLLTQRTASKSAH